MDFLGLRTLTVIQNAVHLVEQDTGVKLDMQHIDYNDKKSRILLEQAIQMVCSSWKVQE